MRSFVLKLVVFLLLQGAGLALLLRYYDAGGTNYFGSIVDKHQRLEHTAPPRIILLGGSNVPFGFDSDVMEKTLGRPVVNMGVAAGLGAEFMLADVESELRAGDILVLSLEYDHFARGAGGSGFDPAVLQQALIFRPKGLLSLGPMHFRKIVLDRGLMLLGEITRRGLRVGVHAKSAERPGERSARAAFNAWGDLGGHRGDPARITAEAVERLPIVLPLPDYPNKNLLRHLAHFVERSAKKGVVVAFTFPPKPEGALRRDRDRADRLAAALREIPGLILLDTPQEQGYPAGQFFDSANHLTAQGAAARTRKVSAALRRILKASPRPDV